MEEHFEMEEYTCNEITDSVTGEAPDKYVDELEESNLKVIEAG